MSRELIIVLVIGGFAAWIKWQQIEEFRPSVTLSVSSAPGNLVVAGEDLPAYAFPLVITEDRFEFTATFTPPDSEEELGECGMLDAGFFIEGTLNGFDEKGLRASGRLSAQGLNLLCAPQSIGLVHLDASKASVEVKPAGKGRVRLTFFQGSGYDDQISGDFVTSVDFSD